MESIKGYKTIIFNVIMTVIMVIALFSPESELPDGDAVQGAVNTMEAALTAVWGVGNVILRAITDSPVFKKEPE